MYNTTGSIALSGTHSPQNLIYLVSYFGIEAEQENEDKLQILCGETFLLKKTPAYRAVIHLISDMFMLVYTKSLGRLIQGH